MEGGPGGVADEEDMDLEEQGPTKVVVEQASVLVAFWGAFRGTTAMQGTGQNLRPVTSCMCWAILAQRGSKLQTHEVVDWFKPSTLNLLKRRGSA